MRKKICIALILSMFVYTKEAYAIFDIMAKVQSALELYKEIETKVQEVQKKLRDIEKRARQGFEMGSSCFKNPTKCDVKALTEFNKKNVKDSIDKLHVIDGTALASGNLKKKSDESVAESIIDGYIYKRGQGDDLKRTSENRRKINGVVADNAAILFAKAVSVRQSILDEDGSLHQTEFKDQTMDELLAAHNKVTMLTQHRISQILELRSFMVGAPATVEITQSSRDSDD